MEKATKAAFTLNGREIYVSVFYSISLFLLFSLKQIHFRPFSVTNDIKIFAIRLDAKRKKKEKSVWGRRNLVENAIGLRRALTKTASKVLHELGFIHRKLSTSLSLKPVIERKSLQQISQV